MTSGNDQSVRDASQLVGDGLPTGCGDRNAVPTGLPSQLNWTDPFGHVAPADGSLVGTVV